MYVNTDYPEIYYLGYMIVKRQIGDVEKGVAWITTFLCHVHSSSRCPANLTQAVSRETNSSQPLLNAPPQDRGYIMILW